MRKVLRVKFKVLRFPIVFGWHIIMVLKTKWDWLRIGINQPAGATSDDCGRNTLLPSGIESLRMAQSLSKYFVTVTIFAAHLAPGYIIEAIGGFLHFLMYQ